MKLNKRLAVSPGITFDKGSPNKMFERVQPKIALRE